MTAATAKSIKKYQHPALNGLSDKALVAFYSAGNIVTLEPKSYLIREGDQNADSFLVLNGRVALVKGTDPMLTMLELGQGGYVSSALCKRGEQNRYSMQALTAVNIFRFNDSVLSGLEPEAQLLVCRNLEKLSADSMNLLIQNQASKGKEGQLFAVQMLENLDEQLQYYNASKSIMDLLRKIPRLPSYATRLTSMLSDDGVSAKDAIETAKLDPSVTASVLKTVNSAMFGLRHKVMDFQHAFLLLGFNKIQQIIINRGIQSTMPKTPEFQQLQFHSVMISALSQEISLTVKQGTPQVLGTLGLLHDIGKSVLLLLKREHGHLSFFINLLNADLIGTLLLREWQIPDEICLSLEYQSLPYQAPPQVIPESHRMNMAILYLAHLCFDFMMEKPVEARQLRYFEEYAKVLGSTAPDIASFIRLELSPAVQSRLHTLPKVIQNFLRKGQTLTSTEEAHGPKLDLMPAKAKTGFA